MPKSDQFMIEEAQVIFRNFEGKEGQYNQNGDRNFAVIIPDEKTAQKMLKDRWNIKYLEAREEGEPNTPYIQVAVNFKQRPPHIVMLTSRARTILVEDTVAVLDFAEIEKVDLICRGYEWNVNGKAGVKAYLKSLFVTVEEDELERKYSEINESQ